MSIIPNPLASSRLKIVQCGNPVLRGKSRELSVEEIRSREVQDLIEFMRETMYDAPGVGLAAPQVGIPLQLAVIEDKADYLKGIDSSILKERERQPVPFHVIVNPQLKLDETERVQFYEGCLSVAGFTARVERARRVTVSCLDFRGEPLQLNASGWYARILQGTLYIDRMQTRSFATLDNYGRYGSSHLLQDK
jgi:peptide deformylase